MNDTAVTAVKAPTATALERTLVNQVHALYSRLGVNGPVTDEATQERVNAELHNLTGDDPHHIFDRVVKLLTDSGWSVEFGEMPDAETHGYTDPKAHKVMIADGLSDAMKAYVVMHEAGHVWLRHIDDPFTHILFPEIQEMEAEVFAYVAGGLQGLDTSDTSVGYVASWGGGAVDMVLKGHTRRPTSAARQFSHLLDSVVL